MKATRRRGFTLVEMLMVVTVIGILILLLVVSITGATRTARSARVETEVAALEQAFQSYHQLYSKWPRHPIFGSGHSDPESNVPGGLAVNHIMIRLLRGGNVPPGANPRTVVFMEISDASLNASNWFVDAWGEPYRYMLDFNYDGNVLARGVAGSDVLIPGRSVAVWSRGPPDEQGQRNSPIVSWE